MGDGVFTGTRDQTSSLIFEGSAPTWRRVAVPVFAVVVYFGADRLSWWLRRVTGIDLVVSRLSPGPRTLVFHAFVYTLFTAAACAVAWAALIRARVLRPPTLRLDASTLGIGLALGIAVSLVTSIAWRISGGTFQFVVEPWKMIGDLLSNAYEEIADRGLIFGAFLYGFRKPVVAAVLAGVVFGAMHSQYPLWLQGLIAVVGAALSIGYLRAGTLVAPWIGHQVFDMILDTVLRV
jgi:membrane protease YdiL (CAAX protease family)